MRVIDACAGAGGKSLHLAALLKNKGRIVALDTVDWKLEELKKRAKRAGAADIIETRVIESMKSIKRLYDSADRLLLDVPCSGLGVLKRNPDAKWKLSEEFIKEVRQTQSTILNEYSPMVKPGGLMVYSTCSILPSENEKQVETFLNSNQGKFELIEENHLLPSEGFDGFYMALIRRTA
jgi:16S rRNA (cytosine967-C5)-methyltransferase